jgi:hypothetical protein
MRTIYPPNSIADTTDEFRIFLAGSIEMGLAENWQQYIETELVACENVCLFNPRRTDWDASWKQEKDNAQFNEQVNWELNGLEQADVIACYFAPGTKSPISMLELGLFARTGKLVVCCPEGFWRKGNIDIVCEKYGIRQVGSLPEMVDCLKSTITILQHKNEK